jgi:hypothetical protein
MVLGLQCLKFWVDAKKYNSIIIQLDTDVTHFVALEVLRETEVSIKLILQY